MSKEIKTIEQVAKEQREILGLKNIYNQNDPYSGTHTRALSDDATPEHGKGTGKYGDTANGGSRTDIKGNPAIQGSGREGNVKFNKYNPNKSHQRPE